jgi:hypothetical protein
MRLDRRFRNLVGSNADEATVFAGPNTPRTVAQYRKYLEGDTGKYSDQEFYAYPVASDADVPAQYLLLQNDSLLWRVFDGTSDDTRW